MQKLCFFVFIILAIDVYSQTMYVNNEKIAACLRGSFVRGDENVAARHQKSYGYGVGLSLFNIFDLGITEYKSTITNKPSTIITNLDFHAKNKLISVAINTAYSNTWGDVDILIGASIYRRFILFEESLNIYPTISAGSLLNSGWVMGIGFPIEKNIGRHFSIIFTPGFNLGKDAHQILFALEFLIK